MKLYSFGSNGSYQLGLTHNDDVMEPTACTFREKYNCSDTNQAFELPSITRVVGGGNHTFIQLSNGALKAAGENTGFRCGSLQGQASEDNRNFLLGFQESTQNVVLSAATWESSAVVVRHESSYAILTIGTGPRGELGQGPDISSSNQWKTVSLSFGDVLNNAYPIDLCGGMNHFIAILSDGDVYGWGKGRNGQLGNPRADSWNPRKISIPFKAVRAVCGREFTYILGDPTTGEHIILGSDKNYLVSNAPAVVPHWKDVGATWSSILVLDQHGKLLSWGKPTRTIPPKDLPILEQIAVGSEHVLAKTTEEKVVAWGWGKHGNCGLPVDGEFGDVQGRYNEIPIQGTVKILGAGCATSWIGVE